MQYDPNRLFPAVVSQNVYKNATNRKDPFSSKVEVIIGIYLEAARSLGYAN